MQSVWVCSFRWCVRAYVLNWKWLNVMYFKVAQFLWSAAQLYSAVEHRSFVFFILITTMICIFPFSSTCTVKLDGETIPYKLLPFDNPDSLLWITMTFFLYVVLKDQNNMKGFMWNGSLIEVKIWLPAIFCVSTWSLFTLSTRKAFVQSHQPHHPVWTALYCFIVYVNSCLCWIIASCILLY